MHGSKCDTFPKHLQNEPKVPKELKVNACGELQSAETNIHSKSCAREKSFCIFNCHPVTGINSIHCLPSN